MKRKEPARITIANLEREVRNLTQRCADLVAARDAEFRHRMEISTQRDTYSLTIDSLRKEVDILKTENHNLLGEKNYYEGYVARVKETDGRSITGE